MTKLVDLPPSTRNKGNTSPIKTKTHIYKRKNRWGVVWSDTPVSGKRRNIIDETLGRRIISEFNKPKIDNSDKSNTTSTVKTKSKTKKISKK